jgi:hypothetical protein
VDWAWALLVVWLGTCWAWGSEPVCYRSAQQAAEQAGPRGVAGFRLESLERDPFSGVSWALIRSCAHPERPAVMVMAAAEASPHLAAPAVRSTPVLRDVPAAKPTVLHAGERVRLVETSENTRIEMSGIAQASGAAGDRVRVRLLPLTPGDRTAAWPVEERFVIAVVRGGGVLDGEVR